MNTNFNQINLAEFIKKEASNAINDLFLAERSSLLSQNTSDCANGYHPSRDVKFGTEDLSIKIPRTRNSYYPSMLDKYQRGIGKDWEDFILDLLLNCKNLESLKRTIRGFGISFNEDDLDKLLTSLYQEAQTINSRELDSDYHFIYIDSKVIDIKLPIEEGTDSFSNNNKVKADSEKKFKVVKASHFVVVGIDSNANKSLLFADHYRGNEDLEKWKKVFNNLRSRKLNRVSTIVTDDFSGLTNLISSLFPHSDHQLCTVHLLRNAHKHLDKVNYNKFKKEFDQITTLDSYEDCYDKMTDLIDSLKETNKSYGLYLEKKKEHYILFSKYPDPIRKMVRTTNQVEGFNNAIEIQMRSSGGYFHSDRDLKLKINATVSNLRKGKWKHPAPHMKSNIHLLEKLFQEKFKDQIEFGD